MNQNKNTPEEKELQRQILEEHDQSEELSDFNLCDAIVYSAILERKFEE